MRWALLFLAGCAIPAVGGDATSNCDDFQSMVKTAMERCPGSGARFDFTCDGLILFEANWTACKGALDGTACDDLYGAKPSECHAAHVP